MARRPQTKPSQSTKLIPAETAKRRALKEEEERLRQEQAEQEQEHPSNAEGQVDE